MTHYIDLSHTFTAQMPVYPGDSLPELTKTDHENHTNFHVKTGMHVGTHIDAPLHMIKNGTSLSDIPVDHFFGKGHLIDARNKPITAGLLENHTIHPGDIILIHTGFSTHFRQPEYFENYPEITEEFALKLVDLKVKIVGMDTPSPDREPYKIHKILLGNNILIIENLTNLEQLENKEFEIIALPPKFETDASPLRVVAKVKK